MSRIKSLYKPFEHWQTGTNIFIISDTHFEDTDRTLMGYTVDEKVQCHIIKKGIYGKNSTVIHLGDVGNPEWMKRITAKRKILIKGNHDAGNLNYEPYFDEIYEGAVLIAPKILLSHEPVDLPWCYNIHGHDHSNWSQKEYNPRLINLAGNIVNFKPFNLNDWANRGPLSRVDDIHRITIDKAIKKGE